MVIFCIMIVSIFGAFIGLDMFISRVWDVFSAKSYDMLNMVAEIGNHILLLSLNEVKNTIIKPAFFEIHNDLRGY